MSKTAFLGLDYIIDITCENGKVSRSASQVSQRNVIAKANEAIAIARQRDWLLIQVKVGFSPTYSELPKNSPLFSSLPQVGGLNLAQAGTDFHPELQVEPTDSIVIKHRVSPFYGTDLDLILRTHKIERLVTAGVSSTLVVQSAVREAHDKDYEVIVFEPACAAPSLEAHEAAMQLLQPLAQIINNIVDL